MRAKMARGQRKGRRATELTVSGQVQRVGYRRLVIRAARRNGISGYVKNLRDETVEIVAEGAPAGVRRFIEDISIRKDPILVEGVEERGLRPTGRYHGFTVRPGRVVDELQEGLGAGEERLARLTDEFSDYRKEFGGFHGEFRSYRQEFKDFADRTDSNFKELGGRYDAISEKLSTIMAEMAEQTKKTNDLLESFKAESKESRDRLDESLRLLREAVAKMPSAGPRQPGSP